MAILAINWYLTLVAAQELRQGREHNILPDMAVRVFFPCKRLAISSVPRRWHTTFRRCLLTSQQSRKEWEKYFNSPFKSVTSTWKLSITVLSPWNLDWMKWCTEEKMHEQLSGRKVKNTHPAAAFSLWPNTCKKVIQCPSLSSFYIATDQSAFHRF